MLIAEKRCDSCDCIMGAEDAECPDCLQPTDIDKAETFEPSSVDFATLGELRVRMDDREYWGCLRGAMNGTMSEPVDGN